MLLRELLVDRLDPAVLDTLVAVEGPDDSQAEGGAERQPTAASIHRLTAPGVVALSTWRALRASVDAPANPTGAWPVLLGAEDAPLALRPADERAAALAAARDLVVESPAAAPDDPKLLGSWPQRAAPADHFSVPRADGTDDPLPRVAIALLPLTDGSDLPAWLPLAGPRPELHVAALRRWRRLYGAEVVGLRGGDTLELTVARPPMSRDGALALAREQHAHAPLVVTQGTFTLQALAARLLGGRAWSLWW
jgi:hypothetical protein